MSKKNNMKKKSTPVNSNVNNSSGMGKELKHQ